MSEFEFLTLIFSSISVVVALISLVRTRRLAEEQLRLGRVTEELTKRQIMQIDAEERARQLPRFSVDLVNMGNSYSFVIVNRGEGSAYNFDFDFIDCVRVPIDLRQKRDILPMVQFRPDSRIKLMASICIGSPMKYTVRLQWKDCIGESKTEDFTVTL